MQHNRQIRISTGNSRKAVVWAPCALTWLEFTERLKTPQRGAETLEEYLRMKKPQQDELKDVGGFVGGTLAGNRRLGKNVEGRDLITLDLDRIEAGKTEDVLKRVSGLGCAAAVYSTRKHAPYAPRLRVIIPVARTITADEYEPTARMLAKLIGIEMCDPTTFEASRLMYWPSCCRDSQYVFQVWDNPFCDPGGILGMYHDWKDIQQWPVCPGQELEERRKVAQQVDPTTKHGVVGAFCRTYSVPDAMEKFLPGLYEETATAGRYTYTLGSTAAGAVLYEGDKFLYSHHATDPCGGTLVNAFDLIRLHKFGDMDDESKQGTPSHKMPSYMAMSKFALADADTASLMRKERLQQAKETFGAPSAGGENDTIDDIQDDLWEKNLAVTETNQYQKTINNIVIILENDPDLKGQIMWDEFASAIMVLGALPWNLKTDKRRWTDADEASYYQYLELYYGITGKEKLDAALLIVTDRHRINDVRDYLESLEWDNVHRIDTLLTDYLGAEDSPYVRAVIRKSLCAAVARAIQGGVKYDYMPIFTGPQGIGKSTFLATLGRDWFSDSLTTFEGKEAAELIQGTWINEVGELTAMNRQETNAVKQFLSRKEDIYRAAYGKHATRYPRRCVFFGTSNDQEFLKDATGNRRFWPVDVGVQQPTKSVWTDLPAEVDQIWAEARVRWTLGETLYLPKELEDEARKAQEAHRESNSKEGIVLEFLAKKIPDNWDTIGIAARRLYWGNPENLQGKGKPVDRDKVCAVEVWVECMNGEIKNMKRSDSLEINNILLNLEGWERVRTNARFGPYGRQKGFKKRQLS